MEDLIQRFAWMAGSMDVVGCIPSPIFVSPLITVADPDDDDDDEDDTIDEPIIIHT